MISERFQKLCGIKVETEVIDTLPYTIWDLSGEILEVQALQKNVFKISGKLELIELFYLIQQTFLWPNWHKNHDGKKRASIDLDFFRRYESGGLVEASFSIPALPAQSDHMQKTFDLLSKHGLKFKERV